ncbi:MAG: hypothetical protein AAGJ83_08305, partial [Planctomycetota bacterium]
ARFKQQNSVGVFVLSDGVGGVRNRGFDGPLEDVINEPMNAVRDVINNKAKQSIEFDQQWEITFLLQVSEVMRRPKLSGVHKEWLIYQLLDTATRGSKRLRDMIPQTMQMLVRRSSVRDQWFEAKPINDMLNPELQATLAPELKIAYTRCQNPLADYEAVAKMQLLWIGFLSKDSSGAVEFHPRGELPQSDGKLYIAGPPRQGASTTSILAIGTYQNGDVMLDPNPIYQIPGRPVFWFPGDVEVTP